MSASQSRSCSILFSKYTWSKRGAAGAETISTPGSVFPQNDAVSWVEPGNVSAAELQAPTLFEFTDPD
jgi:hypothetical protein